MKYLPIDRKLFIENRKKLVSKLLPNSVVVVNANDEMPRSADGHFMFRQNSDLFYLTGIDQEQTVLLLCPNHPDAKFREILFLRETSELIAIWDGHKYTIEEAKATSGIESIYWLSDLPNMLPSIMYLSENCYLNLNEHTRMHNEVPDRDLRYAHTMKKSFPLHTYKRLSPIMHDLRAIKDEIEVLLIKEAVNITKKAYHKVLKFVKPGVTEYEVEAEILSEFIRNRATGPAYSSIIASGKNACVLHYVDNNRVCADGDLLLMDFGAEYANYAADLTRTIPINGKFSARQAEVYNAVLRIFRFAQSKLVSGTNPEEYNLLIGEAATEELLKLGLLSTEEVKNQSIQKPAYKKYFMHGTSHYLGLDVHDVGSRYRNFEAGMVFTCEPGIYIPKENIGIRIENDFLITKNGNLDLMQGFPIEIEEIEMAMNA